ncbi:hypothetical protein GA0070607_3777 [Micromonospora coriariae]|uniref:CorA-like Mg2+ transporter protein n=1 Tax=Micromonospora coriariae TaxID=285665 RepID=A0A1C4WKD0_9ACTN|nr:hypothetical protein [Micromonospora coriariae]SCE96662.1 hypothetical protein GA0070607_3777 [Micromonospora coriariae]
MIQLRILAPVVVDYYAVPGASLRDPHGYAGFWADQQPAVDELLAGLAPGPVADVPWRPPSVVLEHTRATRSLNLYRTIDDHAIGRTMHVLTGTLDPEHLPGVFGGVTTAPHAGVIEISFRLYDHGLMLLEMLADVDPRPTEHTDGLASRLDELQARAVAMGERTAREIVARYLDPLLRLLRAADRDNRILAAATPEGDPLTAEFGEPLWVTRSLVLDPAEPGADAVTRHWIKDVVIADDVRDPADRLLDGDLEHLVRWLNYIFLDRTGVGGRMLPGDPFRDQWDALRYAQVFYGALDRIDTRLSKILADSAAADSRWELEQLKGNLLGLSRRAELIIMERQDLSKYLKRAVRAEMDAILEFWDYESLLAQPVRFKIEVCDRRLAELATRRTARSAMFTDLILLGIGVTSILGTALAVTEFGRSMTSDPGMAVHDLGRSSIMAWIAGQPADAVLITSGMVSLLLVIMYLFFRRDRT